jgi:hypothetical protein
MCVEGFFAKIDFPLRKMTFLILNKNTFSQNTEKFETKCLRKENDFGF